VPRYLWGPNGRRWEIVYHQAFRTWEIVDSECPFSLHDPEMSGFAPTRCRICSGVADPAAYLRNPDTGSVLYDTGPICLECACGKRLWYTLVPISIPRSLIAEPRAAKVPGSSGPW